MTWAGAARLAGRRRNGGIRWRIIFDEGPEIGPDQFGAAILDNIEVNQQIAGRGPSDGR